MGLLAEFGVKQPDGTYKNYTISISDKTNDYGQNVTVFEKQTKEQADAREPRKYLGNGRVFWTDGKLPEIVKKQSNSSISDFDDLPY